VLSTPVPYAWAGAAQAHGKHASLASDINMTGFLIWVVLLFVCWPLAILAVLAYPIVWLILLPLRVLGIAVDGVFALLRAVVMLPARLIGGRG
jgi:hypothetical protein